MHVKNLTTKELSEYDGYAVVLDKDGCIAMICEAKEAPIFCRSTDTFKLISAGDLI